jgi:hypothetical protein
VQSLFENCYELMPAFNRLLSRPPVLQLVLGERYGQCQRPTDAPAPQQALYDVSQARLTRTSPGP